MPEKDLTLRQQILKVLEGDMLTAKDISKAVGVKEKDVFEHLEHVIKTAGHSGRFVVKPSECLECGFVFKKRERLKTPARCPVCREEEITETRFGIIKN